MDKAVSANPAVRAQLDRLAALSPGSDRLGLERITTLLARLGDPPLALPPVLHVAGTNGKGSTCAFLRAAIEAAGLDVHVYSSPHLVRFNERIRIAGRLIEDEALARLLDEVLNAADDREVSFFEATTAAAFLAFARAPASACILEVGLGGRLDATNVVPRPAVCGIAELGIDHQAFLGDRIEQIAAEKAGIARPGVPLVTQLYPKRVAERIERSAEAAGAIWLPRGRDWEAEVQDGEIAYRDRNGVLYLPSPRLPGTHQAMNAALAAAMIRHQDAIDIPPSALRAATGWADWPARLQLLPSGPLASILPDGSECWLDGAHNPNAARALAHFFRERVPPGRPFHLVCGLLANKDASGILRAFRHRSLMFHAVPVPGHDHHDPQALAAAARDAGIDSSVAAADVADALAWIARHSDRARPPVILIVGSLYLAGAVLEANGPLPR